MSKINLKNISAKIETSGESLWSHTKKKVTITGLDLYYIDEDGDFGNLNAEFDVKTWNTRKLGLIYTDKGFLREFRKFLTNSGFSKSAAEDVSYSEQGMQGNDYVNFDVGEPFITEFKNLTQE